MTPLHYELPLFPGEIRLESFDGGVRVRVGPRNATQVLAAMGAGLLILALLACLALAGLAL